MEFVNNDNRDGLCHSNSQGAEALDADIGCGGDKLIV